MGELSLREMVLEEELRSARQQLQLTNIEHRTSERAFEQKLLRTDRQLAEQGERLASAQAAAAAAAAAAQSVAHVPLTAPWDAQAAAAAAAAAAQSVAAVPLAVPWELSMETLLELCEQDTRELELMIELRASDEAAAIDVNEARHGLEVAGLIQRLANEEETRRAAEVESASREAGLKDKAAALDKALAEEQVTRCAVEVEVADEAAARGVAEAALADEQSSRAATEAALTAALSASEAARSQLELDLTEAKARLREEEEALARERAAREAVEATLLALRETREQEAGARATEAERLLRLCSEPAAEAKQPQPQGGGATEAVRAAESSVSQPAAEVEPPPPVASSSEAAVSVGVPAAPPVASQTPEDVEKQAVRSARSWLAAKEAEPSPSASSSFGSPSVGPSPSSPVGASSAEYAMHRDLARSTLAASEARLAVGSVEGDRRAGSCSEYLSWRRQVNGLLHLPAPVRGVASSATWGLAETPASARAPRSAAPMRHVPSSGTWDTPGARVPRSAAPRYAGGARRRTTLDATLESELEFAQGAELLQNEMEDLIGNLGSK